MSHLSEELLNEYLDEALDESSRQQAASHLAQCAGCRARLEALQWVFSSLGSLPEIPLARDLTPRVLARLPARPANRLWRLALGLQGATVLAALLWAVSQWQDAFQGWMPVPDWSAFQEWPLLIPIPPLESYQLALLVLATGLLWLAGNLSLLRPRPQEARR